VVPLKSTKALGDGLILCQQIRNRGGGNSKNAGDTTA
jgi:hypothetical protein